MPQVQVAMSHCHNVSTCRFSLVANKSMWVPSESDYYRVKHTPVRSPFKFNIETPGQNICLSIQFTWEMTTGNPDVAIIAPEPYWLHFINNCCLIVRHDAYVQISIFRTQCFKPHKIAENSKPLIMYVASSQLANIYHRWYMAAINCSSTY